MLAIVGDFSVSGCPSLASTSFCRTNLLIAQSGSEHHAGYEDMVGYAPGRAAKLYFLGAWTDEYHGRGILPDWCPGSNGFRGAYGVSSAGVMLIFFVRMLDKAVLDNTLLACVITFASVCTVTSLMGTGERLEVILSGLSFFMVVQA